MEKQALHFLCSVYPRVLTFKSLFPRWRSKKTLLKQQLQQANNKLAGASRRKTEVPGAQVTKRVDDKAKASKDKDKAPSTEGAGP